jgi:hypothetical protein
MTNLPNPPITQNRLLRLTISLVHLAPSIETYRQ